MSAPDEYWINVYRGGRIGFIWHSSVEKCIMYRWVDGPCFNEMTYQSWDLPLYRLHVRLKRKIYNHPSR